MVATSDRQLSSVAQAAKELRVILKDAFPGVEFTVRSESYSMGSSIRVSWWDGPTRGEVSAIASQKERVHRCEQTGDILGGGNRFVQCDRDYSPEFLKEVLEVECRKWGIEVPEITQSGYYTAKGKKSEKYHLGSATFTIHGSDNYHLNDRIWRVIHATTRYTKPDPDEVPEQPKNATLDGVTVSLNEDRDGVEIRFSEKPDPEILEAIKDNGFHWSRFNKCWYAKQSPETLDFAYSFVQSSQVDDLATNPEEVAIAPIEVCPVEIETEIPAVEVAIAPYSPPIEVQTEFFFDEEEIPVYEEEPEELPLEAEEFYPTPKALIEKMIDPYRVYGYWSGLKLEYKGLILEPSGGSGAILDFLKDELRVPQRHLLTLEKNTDLRFTLQGKGYRVLGDDWLEYSEPIKFGMILMNPPFSQGVKHVLKAWDCLSSDGDLVAILPTKTLEDQCYREREILAELVKQHGSAVPVGSAFRNAARKTDVEVSIIRLKKPKDKNEFKFDAVDFEHDQELNEQVAQNPLAHANVIRDLVARYEAARNVLIKRYEEQKKLEFYLQGINGAVYESVDDCSDVNFHQKTDLSAQLCILKSMFWNTVFKKTELGQKAPSHFRETFSQFIVSQSAMAFNEKNIKELFFMFFQTRDESMKKCIVDVFDKATSFHEKNKVHREGWKTNKSYKLNRKIIHPDGVVYDSDRFGANTRIHDFLDDIDKVCCYLSGVPLEEGLNAYKTLKGFCADWNKGGMDYDKPFESKFFRFRIFKKGTLHIEFLDTDLLKQINKIAAEGKNWIGGGY